MKSNQLVLDLEKLKAEYAEQGLEIQVATLEKERLRLKYVSWLIGVGLLFFFVSWHYTGYWNCYICQDGKLRLRRN